MTTQDQLWQIDNGPDTTNCDLGQHDWQQVDCDRCDTSDCMWVCEDCGEEERDCDGEADDA